MLKKSWIEKFGDEKAGVEGFFLALGLKSSWLKSPWLKTPWLKSLGLKCLGLKSSFWL